MRFPDSPFAGKLWLAPLTTGGNLPYRRLCVELGAEVTVGEMAVVRRLLKGEMSELALLRSHPDEPFFGAQLADRDPETLAEGARVAEQRGARFVDLNCGCPIDAITGRGLGASLLKKPARLGRLVEALRAAVGIPVTVKLRTGWSEGSENVLEVARLCEEAGASAITIHGRTREQRYSRAADWELIGQVARERGVPVIGNGDLLTHYEARARWASGVCGLMLARGALISPWLFREIREDRAWLPSPEQRLGVIWRLLELLREHFGVHEKAAARTRRFLAWHLGFFHRYRAFPEEQYGAHARVRPLMHLRQAAPAAETPLQALLDDARTLTHERLADALIAAETHEQALEAALRLQAELPPASEAEAEVALRPAG